jgi:C_GCAxxG_C_C family probable redox protein
MNDPAPDASAAASLDQVEARAVELFRDGYCCAEAVLMAVAEYRGIESPLIPAIATGFCTGMAGTAGMCGALTGGILALNLIHGRHGSADSRNENYRVVRTLIEQFYQTHGATHCTELLGCNPATVTGQIMFRVKNLRCQCYSYAGTVARMAAALAADPTR